MKVKEDLAGSMESIRKDCNKKFHAKELKDLGTDFKAVQKSMG